MVQNHADFESRLRRLTRKHRAMANGYSMQVRPDGLIVSKPRRVRRGISARSVLIFLAVFMLFKGYLIAFHGVPGYEDRVERLRAGSLPEQAGAFVMQVDPLSALAARHLAALTR